MQIERRIALVVPPANPTVEPELHALAPPGCAMHSTRLPLLPGDLAARSAAYPAHYAAALRAFGGLRIDAALIGLTGATYPLGVTGDRALCAELAAGAGFPVVSASAAIHAALRALGANRICLVSPYPAWLTAQSVAYWESGALTVAQVVSMGEEFRAYEMTTAEVEASLARVRPGADAVLFTGTGLITLPAISAQAGRMAAPLLSSNLCGAWWLARVLGRPPAPLLAAAAPALAAPSATIVD
jgi:maleate isomerase